MSARKVNSPRYLRRVAADRAASQARQEALTGPGATNHAASFTAGAHTIRSDAGSIVQSYHSPPFRISRTHADAPIFRLPFRVDRYRDGSPTGFIFDAEGTMVASRNRDTGLMIPRGWGKIGYLPAGERIMDEWVATFEAAGCGVEDPDVCLAKLHALAGWGRGKAE